MFYIFDWKHYMVVAGLTYLSGLCGGWALAKWREAYREAVEAGAVADE